MTGLEVAAAAAEASPNTQIVFVTAYDQYAIDAFDKARVVFHNGGGGEQATGHDAGDDQGGEVGAGSIKSGSEASAAAADDDDVFHLAVREYWVG